MNGEHSINLNAAECLKSQTGFTETVIHNVCNGSTEVVPHGMFDVAMGGTLFLFFFAALVFLIVGMFKLTFD